MLSGGSSGQNSVERSRTLPVLEGPPGSSQWQQPQRGIHIFPVSFNWN